MGKFKRRRSGGCRQGARLPGRRGARPTELRSRTGSLRPRCHARSAHHHGPWGARTRRAAMPAVNPYDGSRHGNKKASVADIEGWLGEAVEDGGTSAADRQARFRAWNDARTSETGLYIKNANVFAWCANGFRRLKVRNSPHPTAVMRAHSTTIGTTPAPSPASPHFVQPPPRRSAAPRTTRRWSTRGGILTALILRCCTARSII